MNVQEQKFYQKFIALAKKDYLSDADALPKFFRFLVSSDYQKACEVWEFFLTEHSELLEKEPERAAILCDSILAIFYTKSAVRCARLLIDNPVVRKAVMTCSPRALTGLTFDITAQALAGGRLEDAEELLKAAQKNPNISYGPIMKELVEKMLVEAMKKAAGGKKAELPKKTSALLLIYIAKIKGGERALLEQRIRELN